MTTQMLLDRDKI